MDNDSKESALSPYTRVRRGWRRSFVSRGMPDVVHYDVPTARWTGPPLHIAALSDFHTISPWMPPKVLETVVDRVNAMPVDIIVLLGDYIAANPTPGRNAPADQIARALSRLRAPLGVHAVMGNHDWRDDPLAKASGFTESSVLHALNAVGIDVLLNSSIPLEHKGFDFHLVGFDSQQGHRTRHFNSERHDPAAAFREVPTDAPAILLAHEPDFFAQRETRALLQLSGHTHGGQASLFGWRPLTPSEHSDRYSYGHVQEHGQHLVVSGGLGYSHVPLRIGTPPELTLVTLHSDDDKGD